jgi:DNA-binding HxlR family transcriptional regulator
MQHELRHLTKETCLRIVAVLGDSDGISAAELGRRVDRGGDSIKQSARKLERDGLLKRTLVRLMPPLISYELTPLGHTYVDAAKAVVSWIDSHEPEVIAHRQHVHALAKVASSQN